MRLKVALSSFLVLLLAQNAFAGIPLGQGSSVPPVIPIEDEPDDIWKDIGDWWIEGRLQLEAAAVRRSKGMDVRFSLSTSTGLTSFDDGRVSASLTIPLFSRSERLKAQDDRQIFLNQGYALIREGKELKRLAFLYREQMSLRRVAINIDGGLDGFQKFQEIRAKLVKIQERAWEVRAAFEALVR